MHMNSYTFGFRFFWSIYLFIFPNGKQTKYPTLKNNLRINVCESFPNSVTDMIAAAENKMGPGENSETV